MKRTELGEWVYYEPITIRGRLILYLGNIFYPSCIQKYIPGIYRVPKEKDNNILDEKISSKGTKIIFILYLIIILTLLSLVF